VTDTTPATTWLTQEAYDRLQAEHAHLTGPGRTEITQRIDAARQEGDLKENGGYHAAKDEQGKMEARIRQLEQLLREAQVGQAPAAADGVVAPGTVVSATVNGSMKMRFLLGSREAVGTTDLDVYSEKSPIGSAVLGKKKGDSASYTAPNGKELSVVVDDVEAYAG
jgi:transcription elongation factor GreA